MGKRVVGGIEKENQLKDIRIKEVREKRREWARKEIWSKRNYKEVSLSLTEEWVGFWKGLRLWKWVEQWEEQRKEREWACCDFEVSLGEESRAWSLTTLCLRGTFQVWLLWASYLYFPHWFTLIFSYFFGHWFVDWCGHQGPLICFVGSTLYMHALFWSYLGCFLFLL